MLAVGASLSWKIAAAWGLVSGVKNGTEAAIGKDAITGKDLSPQERIARGLFGALDVGLAGYAGAKGFKNRGEDKGVGNPVEVVGKGNTGRIKPNTLSEQMAMHEVMSNPLKNATELPIKMKDTRWPFEDGWVKMQNNVKLSNGDTISIHYVYNKKTGLFDDFKFK